MLGSLLAILGGGSAGRPGLCEDQSGYVVGSARCGECTETLEWRWGSREPDSKMEASPGGGVCRFLAKGGILETLGKCNQQTGCGRDGGSPHHPMISSLAG